MVRKVVWSKEASQERNNLFTYWNQRNKSNLYSQKLFFLIKAAIHSLKINPEVGKPTNRKDTKLRIVRDYYIVYRIKPDMIYILSVWDTRQNPIKLEEILNTK
ncbi:MAG: type II toxin-antitoxin system RelE/ParE family toxin [Chitinophagaceae bacterium]|jgi:plasmid stabilization system protein ParE|nr:type II toxin-antitoxin system RelE/ParE family toxin [Chitinophagaceae bacterium]